MKTLRELLKEFNASEFAIILSGNKTIEQVVSECNRGDWLLWIASKLELPERKLIACAGHCVNTVRDLMIDERSIKCVDLCMKFEDESISYEELKKVREDADDAADDACAARDATRDADDYATFSAAADYAAEAAAAAAGVADAALYTTEAASSRAASEAVADYAAEAAAVARKENELQTANIVRERLGQDIINKVNELLNN